MHMQRMDGPLGPRGFLTDAEKENLPTVTRDLIRRILGYLTPCWKQFVLVFATQFGGMADSGCCCGPDCDCRKE